MSDLEKPFSEKIDKHHIVVVKKKTRASLETQLPFRIGTNFEHAGLQTDT